MSEISSTTENHPSTNNSSKSKSDSNSNNDKTQVNKPAKASIGRIPPIHKEPKRPPLTHFLCIPLVTSSSKPQLEQSLNELHLKAARIRASVCLEEEKEEKSSPTTTTTTMEISPHEEDVGEDVGENPLLCHHHHHRRRRRCYIPEDAIRPLGTLHLTLAVLSLGSEERLARATETLHSLDLSSILRDVGQKGRMAGKMALTSASASASTSSSSPIVTNGTTYPSTALTISLQSLHAMRSAKATSVLYAHPHDPTSLLLPFCEAVRSAFREADLLGEDDARELRLHATIVNTIHARGIVPAILNGGNVKKPLKATGLKLDARGWVEEYKGHTWAEQVSVEKVSLCRMAAEKVEGADGARYKEVAANYFEGTQ